MALGGSNVTIDLEARLNTGPVARQLKQLEKQGGTVRFNLDDKGFRQPLGRITGDLSEFQNALDASIARTLAFGAAVGVVNSLANGFKAMVQASIEVEKKLADINVILNQSSAGLRRFSADLFEVAKNTGQSFESVSDAAVELSRQGLGAEETLKRINDAMILTRLSGMDAAKSVETLTAAVNGFGQTALTTTQLVNKLATVDAAFAVSTEDLANALSRAGSTAQAAKVNLDELLAAVTSVQQQTARGGAVIGNAFKSIFTRIQRSGVREALEEIGVSTMDAAGNIRGALDILKDYASVYGSLTDAQRAYTDELVAGVFQINNLRALIKDLGSGFSIYEQALGQSANATDEAVRRNEALQDTMASLLNEATVNAKSLAAALGDLVATPAIKNLLNLFNTVAEGLTKALDPEQGNKLVQGFFKTIGSFISGPGLIIVGAAFIKLFKFITTQIGKAASEVFKIGQAAQKNKQIEAQIGHILANNKNLYEDISNESLTHSQREQKILDFLEKQNNLYRQQESIVSRLAKSSAVGAQLAGASTKSKAGGFIPNFTNSVEGGIAAERDSIRAGVGGASASAKPKVLRGFPVGGGRRETMVANTDEVIVPKFGGGQGSAIFNKDMVDRFGMPEGAKNVARGFIPNFSAPFPKGAQKSGSKAPKSGAMGSIKMNPNGSINATIPYIIGQNSDRFFIASRDQFPPADGVGRIQGNTMRRRPNGSPQYSSAKLKTNIQWSTLKKTAKRVPESQEKGIAINLRTEPGQKYEEKVAAYAKSGWTGRSGDVLDFRNAIWDTNTPIGIGPEALTERWGTADAISGVTHGPQSIFKKLRAEGLIKDKQIVNAIKTGTLDATGLDFAEIGGEGSDKPIKSSRIKAFRLGSPLLKGLKIGSGNTLESLKGYEERKSGRGGKAGSGKGFSLIWNHDVFEAAKGFIPSFATTQTSKGALSTRELAFIKGGGTLKSGISMDSFSKAEQAKLRAVKSPSQLAKEKKQAEKEATTIPVDVTDDITMLIATRGFEGGSYNNTLTRDGDKYRVQYPIRGLNANIPVAEREITDGIEAEMLKMANSAAKALVGPKLASGILTQERLANKGAVGGAAGSIFETALQAIQGHKIAVDDDSERSFDIVGRPNKNLSSLFGGYSTSLAEVKINANNRLQNDMAKKIIREFGPQKKKEFEKNAAAGFIPNFANALEDAVVREKDALKAQGSNAGVYVDQDNRLKGGQNPMGLLVANTRDEPLSGSQGVDRVLAAGRNPKSAGMAAEGYIPSFIGGRQEAAIAELEALGKQKKASKAASEALKEQAEQTEEVSEKSGKSLGALLALQFAISGVEQALVATGTVAEDFSLQTTQIAAGITSFSGEMLEGTGKTFEKWGKGLEKTSGRLGKGLGAVGKVMGGLAGPLGIVITLGAVIKDIYDGFFNEEKKATAALEKRSKALDEEVKKLGRSIEQIDGFATSVNKINNAIKSGNIDALGASLQTVFEQAREFKGVDLSGIFSALGDSEAMKGAAAAAKAQAQQAMGAKAFANDIAKISLDMRKNGSTLKDAFTETGLSAESLAQSLTKGKTLSELESSLAILENSSGVSSLGAAFSNLNEESLGYLSSVDGLSDQLRTAALDQVRYALALEKVKKAVIEASGGTKKVEKFGSQLITLGDAIGRASNATAAAIKTLNEVGEIEAKSRLETLQATGTVGTADLLKGQASAELVKAQKKAAAEQKQALESFGTSILQQAKADETTLTGPLKTLIEGINKGEATAESSLQILTDVSHGTDDTAKAAKETISKLIKINQDQVASAAKTQATLQANLNQLDIAAVTFQRNNILSEQQIKGFTEFRNELKDDGKTQKTQLERLQDLNNVMTTIEQLTGDDAVLAELREQTKQLTQIENLRAVFSTLTGQEFKGTNLTGLQKEIDQFFDSKKFEKLEDDQQRFFLALEQAVKRAERLGQSGIATAADVEKAATVRIGSDSVSEMANQMSVAITDGNAELIGVNQDLARVLNAGLDIDVSEIARVVDESARHNEGVLEHNQRIQEEINRTLAESLSKANLAEAGGKLERAAVELEKAATALSKGNTSASGFVPNFAPTDPVRRAMNTEKAMGGSPVVDYNRNIGTYVRDGKTQKNFGDVKRDHPEGLQRAIKNSRTAQGAAAGFVPNFARLYGSAGGNAIAPPWRVLIEEEQAGSAFSVIDFNLGETMVEVYGFIKGNKNIEEASKFSAILPGFKVDQGWGGKLHNPKTYNPAIHNKDPKSLNLWDKFDSFKDVPPILAAQAHGVFGPARYSQNAYKAAINIAAGHDYYPRGESGPILPKDDPSLLFPTISDNTKKFTEAAQNHFKELYGRGLKRIGYDKGGRGGHRVESALSQPMSTDPHDGRPRPMATSADPWFWDITQNVRDWTVTTPASIDEDGWGYMKIPVDINEKWAAIGVADQGLSTNQKIDYTKYPFNTDNDLVARAMMVEKIKEIIPNQLENLAFQFPWNGIRAVETADGFKIDNTGSFWARVWTKDSASKILEKIKEVRRGSKLSDESQAVFEQAEQAAKAIINYPDYLGSTLARGTIPLARSSKYDWKTGDFDKSRDFTAEAIEGTNSVASLPPFFNGQEKLFKQFNGMKGRFDANLNTAAEEAEEKFNIDKLLPEASPLEGFLGDLRITAGDDGKVVGITFIKEIERFKKEVLERGATTADDLLKGGSPEAKDKNRINEIINNLPDAPRYDYEKEIIETEKLESFHANQSDSEKVRDNYYRALLNLPIKGEDPYGNINPQVHKIAVKRAQRHKEKTWPDLQKNAQARLRALNEQLKAKYYDRPENEEEAKQLRQWIKIEKEKKKIFADEDNALGYIYSGINKTDEQWKEYFDNKSPRFDEPDSNYRKMLERHFGSNRITSGQTEISTGLGDMSSEDYLKLYSAKKMDSVGKSVKQFAQLRGIGVPLQGLTGAAMKVLIKKQAKSGWTRSDGKIDSPFDKFIEGWGAKKVKGSLAEGEKGRDQRRDYSIAIYELIDWHNNDTNPISTFLVDYLDRTKGASLLNTNEHEVLKSLEMPSWFVDDRVARGELALTRQRDNAIFKSDLVPEQDRTKFQKLIRESIVERWARQQSKASLDSLGSGTSLIDKLVSGVSVEEAETYAPYVWHQSTFSTGSKNLLETVLNNTSNVPNAGQWAKKYGVNGKHLKVLRMKTMSPELPRYGKPLDRGWDKIRNNDDEVVDFGSWDQGINRQIDNLIHQPPLNPFNIDIKKSFEKEKVEELTKLLNKMTSDGVHHHTSFSKQAPWKSYAPLGYTTKGNLDPSGDLSAIQRFWAEDKEEGTKNDNSASGFVPNFSAVAGEIAASRAAGYKSPVTPSQVKTMSIPGVGKTSYNTQESVFKAPGMSQPFIRPPANSKAAPGYAKEVKKKFNFNPYAQGFVPNLQGGANFNEFKGAVSDFTRTINILDQVVDQMGTDSKTQISLLERAGNTFRESVDNMKTDVGIDFSPLTSAMTALNSNLRGVSEALSSPLSVDSSSLETALAGTTTALGQIAGVVDVNVPNINVDVSGGDIASAISNQLQSLISNEIQNKIMSQIKQNMPSWVSQATSQGFVS